MQRGLIEYKREKSNNSKKIGSATASGREEWGLAVANSDQPAAPAATTIERTSANSSLHLPCLPSFAFPSSSSPSPFPSPPLSLPPISSSSPHHPLPRVCPSSPPSLWLYLSFILKSHSRAMRNTLRSCPTNMSKAMLIVQPPHRHRRSRSLHSQFPHVQLPPPVCDTGTHRAVSPSSPYFFMISPSRFSHSISTFIYPHQGLWGWLLRYGLALRLAWGATPQ